VRLRGAARAAARPGPADPRARGARRPGAPLLPADPSAAVLSRPVRPPAGRLPGDRGGGGELPRAAVLRHDARGAGRLRVRCARRGARARAPHGAGGTPRRRVRGGKMSRITSLLLRHRAPITTLFNLTLAAVAWVAAFALRFDLSVPARPVSGSSRRSRAGGGSASP